MLAISVREAIRDAVAAFGRENEEVLLASPATCEAIFMAVQQRAPQLGVRVQPLQTVDHTS
jgi:xanthine dehydrogenase molybdopterin-binding subunit B